jgi:hypothetical protein
MDNGVRCALEGSWTTQATVNGWRNEYIRADGSARSLILDRGSTTCRSASNLYSHALSRIR